LAHPVLLTFTSHYQRSIYLSWDDHE